MTLININQFAQTTVRGALDQQIAKSGVVQGQVSAANTTTPIEAGDFVDLDPAVTVVGAPQFTTALDTDKAFGVMVFDPKASTVLTPGVIQVAMLRNGPVVWLTASNTIAPGALVEQAASGGDVALYGTATSILRGLALDPGSAGNLMRVVLLGSLTYP